MADAPMPNPAARRIGDIVALALALVAVIYSASGPLADFVHWVITHTTPGLDEMSRRDQRALLRRHRLGAAHDICE